MKHKSKSEHVQKLMHGHHSNGRSPADILMRGHHAEGGPATKVNTPALRKGGKACYATGGHVENEPKEALKRGGKARRHRDMGGPATEGPTNLGNATSMNQPRQQQPLMGANPATYSPTPLKKGGRAHREHHAWGEVVGKLLPHVVGGISALLKKSEGGKVNTGALKRAMGGAAKVRKGIMTEEGRIR